MTTRNLLILMSDEHNPKVLGCAGHPLVWTPNLDALAARGTRFASAYCTTPVCVPARASFATGRYVHQHGYWDNADPYDGRVPSWHHTLRANGNNATAIGKLHFRSHADDHGFTEEIDTMHVVEAVGDLMGLVRDELPTRKGSWKMANMAGPGLSPYNQYDLNITDHTEDWLRRMAVARPDKPWVLFVSFVAPHFPLKVPQEFFDLYPLDRVPWPKLYDKAERPEHPFLTDYARSFNYDDHFDEHKVRVALAAYLGLVSFLDHKVGRILKVLEEVGLAGDTNVVYTSDHGDNLGSRGLWGKSTMYEESVGVPLILAGPDIPAGQVVEAPASHVDFHPTILDAAGLPHDPALPGVSLFELVNAAAPDRPILAEYHGMGSRTAAYMLRHGRYKYVRYQLYRPQLFDLAADPEEVRDLAGDPAYAPVLAELEARLREQLDPEAVDSAAKQRQAEQLARHGGREAVIARGDLGFSPPPGIPADFN